MDLPIKTRFIKIFDDLLRARVFNLVEMFPILKKIKPNVLKSMIAISAGEQVGESDMMKL